MLLFGDYLKIVRKICSEDDFDLLLDSLDGLEKWWIAKGIMALNTETFISITFRCHIISLPRDNTIENSILRRLLEVNDLGVIFKQTLNLDSSGSSGLYQSASHPRACTVGRLFTDLRTLRLLYCAFARHPLDPVHTVENPHREFVASLSTFALHNCIWFIGLLICAKHTH